MCLLHQICCQEKAIFCRNEMEPILVNSAAGRPGLKKWKPVVSWLWKLAMLLFPMGTGTHCLYAFFSSKWLNPPPGGVYKVSYVMLFSKIHPVFLQDLPPYVTCPSCTWNSSLTPNHAVHALLCSPKGVACSPWFCMVGSYTMELDYHLTQRFTFSFQDGLHLQSIFLLVSLEIVSLTPGWALISHPPTSCKDHYQMGADCDSS